MLDFVAAKLHLAQPFIPHHRTLVLCLALSGLLVFLPFRVCLFGQIAMMGLIVDDKHTLAPGAFMEDARQHDRVVLLARLLPLLSIHILQLAVKRGGVLAGKHFQL